MPGYTLSSGAVGPDGRWGWLLSAGGSQIGYHDGVFAPDPDTDARAARAWANGLTGVTDAWTPGDWSACGPRTYTA